MINWRSLLLQFRRRAFSFAPATIGMSRAARMPIIATTTSNSMSVKALLYLNGAPRSLNPIFNALLGHIPKHAAAVTVPGAIAYLMPQMSDITFIHDLRKLLSTQRVEFTRY